MEAVILAIMMYLQVIFAGGTYKQSELNHHYETNKPQIEQIQNDDPLMQQIEAEYGPQVPSITIINDDQTRYD